MSRKCEVGCTCKRHIKGHARRNKYPAAQCPRCGWIGTITDDYRLRYNEQRWHDGFARDYIAARAIPLCVAAQGYSKMTVDEIHAQWPITNATPKELQLAMSDAVLDKLLDVMAGLSIKFPYHPPRGLRDSA